MVILDAAVFSFYWISSLVLFLAITVPKCDILYYTKIKATYPHLNNFADKIGTAHTLHSSLPWLQLIYGHPVDHTHFGLAPKHLKI